MTLHPNTLPALAWFYCVAKHRSFSKAALEMEVSRPALSQHVKALEQQFGVRLFHRTTRSMSLTEEGKHLFDTLTPAFQQIEKGLLELQEAPTEPRGLIRINTSRLASRILIEPHLTNFLKIYPKVRIELLINDGLTNIITEGVDIGIRLGQSLDEHMVAIPLTPVIKRAIVATPAYFKNFGTPQHPKDLQNHNCLAYRYTSSTTLDRWHFQLSEDTQSPIIFEPKGNLIFNDDESMIHAALQGLGIMSHFDLCMQPYLENGRLIRILPEWCQPFSGFYLYTPSRTHMPAKIRVLIDFLVGQRENFKH